MKRNRSCLLILLLLPGFAPAVGVEDSGAVADKAIRAGFTELEKRLIRRYLGEEGNTVDRSGRHTRKERTGQGGHGKKANDGHDGRGKSKSLPPGLAKRRKLPPGLEMQLERNGRLPPGLEKRELPEELERRLGPPPEGTERVIVDDDVVLVEKASGIIIDILRDVLKK